MNKRIEIFKYYDNHIYTMSIDKKIQDLMKDISNTSGFHTRIKLIRDIQDLERRMAGMRPRVKKLDYGDFA